MNVASILEGRIQWSEVSNSEISHDYIYTMQFCAVTLLMSYLTSYNIARDFILKN